MIAEPRNRNTLVIMMPPLSKSRRDRSLCVFAALPHHQSAAFAAVSHRKRTASDNPLGLAVLSLSQATRVKTLPQSMSSRLACASDLQRHRIAKLVTIVLLLRLHGRRVRIAPAITVLSRL